MKSESELEQWIADKAQEYAKLEAHAEALAEALRHLLAITRNENATQYKAATEALAAWKEAKQ